MWNWLVCCDGVLVGMMDSVCACIRVGLFTLRYASVHIVADV